MSGPMDDAYRALGEALADALVASAFLSAPELLEIDPTGDWEPDGETTELQTGAALVRIETRPVRQIFGGTRRHWVVERDARLGLSICGPVPDGDPSLDDRLAELSALVAALPATDPTLGGLCERLDITGADDDDLPPDGLRRMLTFTLRVRAGDPLGLTAL